MVSLDKGNFFRFATGVVFIGFIIIIVSSYNSSKKEEGDAIVPIIVADDSPIKVRPENEGGIEIPFRETGIYDSVKEESIDDVKSSKVVDIKEISKDEVIFEKEEAPVVEEKKEENIDSLIDNLSSGKSADISTEVIKVSGNYRAQLASLKSKEDAENTWSSLKNKYSSVLSGLDLYIEEANTAKGKYYRVQTSSITKDAANSICNSIKQCLVVKKK